MDSISLYSNAVPLSHTDTQSIRFDPAAFQAKSPMQVQHSLQHHPLLQKSSLLALAKRDSSPQRLSYYSGTISPGSDFGNVVATHGDGLSLEATLDRIEEGQAWMVFRHIERDPVYKPLVDALLDDVQPRIETQTPGMCGRQGWIFLSAPGAITPFHLDHENGLILQVHGRKTVNVWNPADRDVVTDRALELFLGPYSTEEIRYQERFQERATTFDLSPGQGVYVPITAPHWVKTTEEGYSISLSVMFRTQSSERRETLYKANHFLRGRGLKPHPIGVSSVRDGVKYHTFRGFHAARSLVSRARRRNA